MAGRKPGRRPKPVREVITNPSVKTTPRSAAAAQQLGQTVKGFGRPPSPGGAGGTNGLPRDGNNVLGNVATMDVDGNSQLRTGVYADHRLIQNLPLDEQLKRAKAAVGSWVGTDQSAWSKEMNDQYAEYQKILTINDQLGGLPLKVNQTVNAVLDFIQGNAAPVPDHIRGQTTVGGTKGTPKPVDRSEALKQAWITRKQRYGSSGKKDS